MPAAVNFLDQFVITEASSSLQHYVSLRRYPSPRGSAIHWVERGHAFTQDAPADTTIRGKTITNIAAWW